MKPTQFRKAVLSPPGKLDTYYLMSIEGLIDESLALDNRRVKDNSDFEALNTAVDRFAVIVRNFRHHETLAEDNELREYCIQIAERLQNDMMAYGFDEDEVIAVENFKRALQSMSDLARTLKKVSSETGPGNMQNIW